MRSRLFAAAILIAASAFRASAQDAVNGLMPGDYLRVTGGIVTPVSPQGTLRDWQRGTSFGADWESWEVGETDPVGKIGFGFGGNLSFLPFNGNQFLISSAGAFTSASAKPATLIEINTITRIRFPAPAMIPMLNLGIGFVHWAPGEITFSGPGQAERSASQGSRSGIELSIGASVDRQLVDRYALFAEATYAYGYTGFGNGFATTAGTQSCGSGGCFSTLTNTTIAVIRAGLRVRISRDP